jgi:hypothetical protein
VTTKGFSVQAICHPRIKAYQQLCDYIAKSGKVYVWVPGQTGQKIQHKSSNRPGYVEFEATSREVLLAWLTDGPSPESLESFIGLLVRCFGDELVAINVPPRF